MTILNREEIVTIRKNLFKCRFQNELTDLTRINTNNISTEPNKERINQLNDILQGFETQNKSEETFDSYLDKINKYAYQKSWARLPTFHKHKKLKKFAKEQGKNKTDQSKIYDYLVEQLDNKKIQTKHVTYDSKEGTIQKIKGFDVEKILS